MQQFGTRTKGLVVSLQSPWIEEIGDGNCLIRRPLPDKAGLSPVHCSWCSSLQCSKNLPQLNGCMFSGTDAVPVWCDQLHVVIGGRLPGVWCGQQC